MEGASAPICLVDLLPNLPLVLYPRPQETNEARRDTFGTHEILHHLAGAEIVEPLLMSDNQAQITVSEPSAVESMLASLTESIKKGFLTSEANQAEIRLSCDSLEKKIDLLALRTQALEESVETMREDLRKIQQLKGTERDLQEKLEHLENNSRRNNLRILNVLEGVEGSDLKKYIAPLIKKVIPLD
ncbi:hypothetical protein NDU88_008216 [Pleurodeles waltl]|uniref:Uncharacterized protein n=1 Tax=Pleurodeles waltl TaxID=8319 RepID=A0AAV7VRW7_PLEWA|nr:hypothetical protein NDU88_008216 [Pleurodeles waltl]